MSFRKKKQENILPARIRPVRGGSKNQVEDLFPFEVSPYDPVPPEIKQQVAQLQKEYIERHNVLVNNRLIFEEIIESIATQLDEKGVTPAKLTEMYRYASYLKEKQSEEEHK